MEFITPKLENFLGYLNKITEDSKALWGEMPPQRMVEHLTDAINLSLGKLDVKLEIKEEHIAKAQAFLESEHPMPKNFKVNFASNDIPNRNENLKGALNEFAETWNAFEKYYQAHPDAKVLHPNFGELNYEQWLRTHSKHFTHHIEQFGLND